MSGSDPAWSMKVEVEDIPETGQHFDLAADAIALARLTKEIGLRELPRAEASFDVTRRGQGGLRVRGHVSAAVGQSCVVTLDPMESTVSEDIDLVFMPEQQVGPPSEELTIPVGDGEPPEPLQDGMVDLGAIATEFLILGIDPYPRKPDVVFEALPAGDPKSQPFAALAALKDGKNMGSKKG